MVAEASWCQCHSPKVVTVPPSPLPRDHPSAAATYRLLRLPPPPPPAPRPFDAGCGRLRPEAQTCELRRMCAACGLRASGAVRPAGCSIAGCLDKICVHAKTEMQYCLCILYRCSKGCLWL